MTGCVAMNPEPSISASAPAELPGASSSARDTASPASWIISYEGVGPLTIDGFLSTEAKELGSSYVRQPVDYCQFSKPTVFLASDDATLWVQSDYDNGVVTDSIGEIAVGLEPAGRAPDTESPRTAEGIGVGSTETALKSAYPSIDYDAQPFADATHYLLTDGIHLANGAQHYLLFVVKSGVVSGIVVQRHSQYLYRYCEDQG
jgi:hypothetical protein